MYATAHCPGWTTKHIPFVEISSCLLIDIAHIILFHTGLGWPLNYHFMFDLLAVLALVTIGISLFLPKTVEKKREVFVNVNRILQ